MMTMKTENIQDDKSQTVHSDRSNTFSKTFHNFNRKGSMPPIENMETIEGKSIILT